MGSVSFLQDLAVVLLASGLVTLLFHRANQPRVVGYILAGLLIGPHTPPFSFVSDETTIHAMADLGVVFLMFSLGLEFNFKRIRGVGLTALVTAILDVSVMVCLGYKLGRWMGWSPTESLFLGGIVCDSSTTILMKILQDLKKENDKSASLAIGISVVEDVLAVGMMALLTGVSVSGAMQPAVVAGRLWTLGIFLVVVIVFGLMLVPRLLNYLARFDNDELLVVTGGGLCFGVALAAVKLQLSMALGAVLVGMLASEARVQQRLALLVAPLRSIFSAVFFVSVGLMLDLGVLRDQWLPVLLVTGLVLAGKFVMNTAGAILTGESVGTSLRVGAGMAQTGEFAFIIAALGVTLHATGTQVYQVGVAVAVLTIVISPYLIRWMDARAEAVAARSAESRWLSGLQLYSQWVERIREARQPSAVRQVIRRSVFMMVINVLLIAAILGTAAFAAQSSAEAVPAALRRPGLYPALLWLCAMVVSLPLYLVTLRKFNALGMVLAEVGLPATVTAPWARHVRAFIAHAVTLGGAGALAVLTVLVSAGMLPARVMLVLLLTVIGAITIWGRPRFLKLYTRAQTALLGALRADNGEAPASPGPSALANGTLGQLQLETVDIGAGTVAVGQTLRDLHLRAQAGVSVVGVERGGQQMVNPDPGMPLQPGDRLVMLGSLEQVRAAETLLSGTGPAR